MGFNRFLTQYYTTYYHYVNDNVFFKPEREHGLCICFGVYYTYTYLFLVNDFILNSFKNLKLYSCYNILLYSYYYWNRLWHIIIYSERFLSTIQKRVGKYICLYGWGFSIPFKRFFLYSSVYIPTH